jgi:predicted DNA-binding transcriptional regulator AlpA
MHTQSTRYVGRQELSDLLSMKDLEGVVRLPDFPAAYRINSRVCRWSYEEVQEWLGSKRDDRHSDVLGIPVAQARRARRRPR